jgi:L-alanine-DL-glutamate epimerase-like enolase superfamily enzyme
VPLQHSRGACWDLKGKAIGRPLRELLGGRLRDEVPFASYIFYRHADESGVGRVSNTDEVLALTAIRLRLLLKVREAAD